MKINIDDTAKMSTALSLAERGRYAEALLLFAQVNSYESALNQVACLCGMEEDGYASDLYRKIKQKYGFTHAVYADALSFGEVMDTVLDFCESDREYARKHDGSLRADTALLAKVSCDYDEDAYDEDPPESFFSTPVVASAQGFYNVSGPMYINSLRAKFEDAMMNGDEKTVKELYKTALALDRADLETLELQLALITVRQKFKGKTALLIAQKFADCSGGGIMATGTALEIVLHNGPYKNIEVLGKLVRKLLPNAEKIGARELAELAFISNDVLDDEEMAYRYAQILYTKKDEIALDDYKVCATAFFNHGDRTLAKEAMITLGRYVPHDAYVAFWKEFVDHAPRKKALLQMGEKTVRHFYVPYAVMSYINSVIGQKLLGESMSLNAEDLRHVSVLFTYIKSLLIVGENNKYQEMSAYIRAILHTVPPRDNQDFFDFALDNLLTMVNDHLLNQTLIARLAEFGFDRKVFVGLAENYQVVDFSQVPKGEVRLYPSLGIALSVTRVEVSALVAAYDKLKPLADGEELSLGFAHNLAYAMLCIAKPNFPETEDSEFFAESEKELFIRYVRGRTEKK